MDYWNIEKTEYDDEEKRMIMSGKEDSDRILAVSILKDGKIRFQEKCDTYFFEDYTKEEALKLVSELKFFIENS